MPEQPLGDSADTGKAFEAVRAAARIRRFHDRRRGLSPSGGLSILPYLRERRGGHILGVTSMGGLAGFPGVSGYCGSKYALEGILESLAKEVAGFGIRVTAIEPGSFRTDWAGRSMTRVERTIADYDAVFEPIRDARRNAGGRQLGDPDRAGEAVLCILDAPEPPGHLVLGSDALRVVRAGRAAVEHDIDVWEHLSRSTDFAR